MSVLAVLASGTGTLLEAMLSAGLRVDLVISDRYCRAFSEVARQQGIPAIMIKRDTYKPDFDRRAYTDLVLTTLEARRVDLVALAGFKTFFDPIMFGVYAGRMLNTHPSLLPAFKGANAVRDTIASGVMVTGCTIHQVTAELDEGPIIAQAPVRVLSGDTEASLHERIKRVERELYPEVIRDFL